ncbi:MAG TPA: hypothetical protein VEX13_16275 [Chloroflexia bacterium]|nr:hypothetical protein [Chloroflexia bacterium]
MSREYTPFNGDKFVEAEFKKLVEKHGINTIIETGTFRGDTTRFLASIAPCVVTIELIERWDHSHLSELPNVVCLKGDSGELVREAVEMSQGPFLFFLDAHWYHDTPTPRELATIANLGIAPVIVIHDFEVPGTTLRYDKYPDFKYDWDHVKYLVEAIYGEDGFISYYNDEHSAEGMRRGVIYIEPKLKVGALSG